MPMNSLNVNTDSRCTCILCFLLYINSIKVLFLLNVVCNNYLHVYNKRNRKREKGKEREAGKGEEKYYNIGIYNIYRLDITNEQYLSIFTIHIMSRDTAAITPSRLGTESESSREKGTATLTASQECYAGKYSATIIHIILKVTGALFDASLICI